MTREAFKRRANKIRRRNAEKQQRQKLRQLKAKTHHKKIETNKLIALYLFLLFNVIIIYAMVAMWKLGDLSYLGVLISDIAAQVITYAIYCVKAYCGKKQEENMKFEREKLFYDTEETETPTDEPPAESNGGF